MKKNKLSILSLFLIISFFCAASMADVSGANEEQQNSQRVAHFKNIDELVSLGAPGLALHYLLREQAKYNEEEPTEWLFWQQKQLSLLKYMHNWQGINQHIAQQMQHLSNYKVATADRNWFMTLQLQALVELGLYDQALEKSRHLLWNASSLVRTNSYASWRRLIIKIYLHQAKIHDAQIAMRRYQQDYGEFQNEDGMAWLQLQAQLLIQLKQYSEAITLLKKLNTPESQAMVILAKLRAKTLSPMNALDSSQLVLASISEDDARKEIFQYVSLVASIAAGENSQAMVLLEVLLSSQQKKLPDPLVKIGGIDISADQLWGLYISNGTQLANANGLLSGDDASWYSLASNLFETQPNAAKSIFAVLSLKAKLAKHRELSMQQLVKIIDDRQSSLFLINRLFTQSKYFPDITAVAAEVRYRLIDFNLSRGNIKSAAALMHNLKQPPKDQPQFSWNLRRARVLILSGSFEQGAQLLTEMLGAEEVKTLQAEKYLQVIFDLQAVEQYRLSLDLFNKLQALISDAGLLREIKFWKAESYFGLKDYEQAAFLFLKSAPSPDHVYDPWYHTATFRAAESMFNAGLYNDAKQRYFHLLKITQSAARKAVIRQKLQAIQLKSAHQAAHQKSSQLVPEITPEITPEKSKQKPQLRPTQATH